ncbi:MAG TPA: hypothetical protein VFL66_01375 [Gaiellaceae bacterium]|nr:hypothetical protein [Gaiellaceae bacterium]
METSTRRAVAVLAGSLITGRRPRTIYDHEELYFAPFNGTVERGRAALVDLDTEATIVGKRHSFYHSGTGAYLRLEVHGHRFRGVDHASGDEFSGTVEARRVEIYDAGAGETFRYSL